MAEEGVGNSAPVTHVTLSGIVRGGAGWNDPPVCQFDPTLSSKSDLGTRLREVNIHRRRGGHSMMALSGGASVASAQGLDPSAAVTSGVLLYPPAVGIDPSTYTAPIIVPTMPSNGGLCGGPTATNPVTSATVAVLPTGSDNEFDVPEFEDDEQVFHYVITRLQRALKDSRVTLEARAYEEINKKVNVFSDMWKNGKISYPVKSTMARLATAIHKRRCDIADQLQASLMMDHVSEVSKWLVGIKRLIQEVRHTEAPMSPSCVVSPLSSPDATSAAPMAAESSKTADDLQNNVLPAADCQLSGADDASGTSCVDNTVGADRTVEAVADSVVAAVSETDKSSPSGSCDTTCSTAASNDVDIVNRHVSDTSADTAPAASSLSPVDIPPSTVDSSVDSDQTRLESSGIVSDSSSTHSAAVARQDSLLTPEEQSATSVEREADDIVSDVATESA